MEVERGKRPLGDGEEKQVEPKRAREGDTADERATVLSKTKRQIEYYLSDDNLRYDTYFQTKIKENSEGWLPMGCILSCKRIQTLGVTAEDICAALRDSTLVEIKDNEFLRRTGGVAPPPLEERPPRRATKAQKRTDDHHTAGCLIKMTNVPEEAGWEAVKAALSERLPAPTPKPQTPEEIAAGKKPFYEFPIKFVSTPDSQCVCYAFLAPFEKDQEVIKTWEPLDINGQKVTVALITEWPEAQKFVASMPNMIQRRREKEIHAKKAALNSRPISIAGYEFASIDHLRKCLKEVMHELPAGKMVNNKTSEVLRGLLQYHPAGAKKLENAVGFKVDIGEKATKSGESTRCFYVVRSDDTCEDFSLQKCFGPMSRNPPFAQPKTAAANTVNDDDTRATTPTTTEQGSTDPAATVESSN